MEKMLKLDQDKKELLQIIKRFIEAELSVIRTETVKKEGLPA